MSVGLPEILLILLVVLLVFGAKRIPEIAKALGRASYEFRKAKTEIQKETDSLINESEKLAEKDSGKYADKDSNQYTKKDVKKKDDNA
ncbi:MAG: sec-independent protein translocase protein TatA [Verrucomicrobiota bacterium]|jgi:sec-independent protein translocase protein TatA|nr:sec-independent protein translocase protein TatA [Verrucomicrobiota bacterium]MDK2963973.1 sec-independent protein translocase protein TatA [Verrucomicrobiota bacterium]